MDKPTGKLFPETDEVVIGEVLQGNTALFGQLIRNYNTGLYKVARSYGFNHQDAQDLMQEAYISAYSNLHQFGFRSSFKTWITKILIRKCLHMLANGQRNKETTDTPAIQDSINTSPMTDLSSNSSMLARKDFSRMLEHCLEDLPEHYRVVFILREVEGFSVIETAELLNITTINVKVRTNRAKSMLQKKLETYYSTSDIYEFNEVYCDKMVTDVMARLTILIQ